MLAKLEFNSERQARGLVCNSVARPAILESGFASPFPEQ